MQEGCFLLSPLMLRRAVMEFVTLPGRTDVGESGKYKIVNCGWLRSLLKSVRGIARLLYAYTLKSLNATSCSLQPGSYDRREGNQREKQNLRATGSLQFQHSSIAFKAFHQQNWFDWNAELGARIDITLSHSFRALTSMEAGVNWVRLQWRDVKYLTRATTLDLLLQLSHILSPKPPCKLCFLYWLQSCQFPQMQISESACKVSTTRIKWCRL